MTASYPTSIKSFTAKTDNVDTVSAVDINSAYDEITAIETYNGSLIYKNADETVNNSSVLQNDDVLTLPVVASGVYKFDMLLIISGVNTTADFKYGWTVPAGCTMLWSDVPWPVAVASSPIAAYTEAIAATCGSINGTWMIWVTGVIINSTNAGNATLQWAQNTAGATNTVVKKGSHIKYYRMA